MVFFNYATMQMAAKIVYYGPGLCGKTTNLHHIYAKTTPQSRGEMVSLETETDRTLFFDLLPIDVGVIGGFKTRLQLYTVPGQVFYNTTRKLVLKGVDGIVFVADSQKAMLEANVESFQNLRENLAEIGSSVDEIPLVIQLNKRDLPNIVSPEVLLNALDPDGRAEHVEAIAARGTGVFETLKLISKLTLRTLRRRMTGEQQGRPAPTARISAAQLQVKSDGDPATSALLDPPVSATHGTAKALDADEIAELAESAERVLVGDREPEPEPEPEPQVAPFAEEPFAISSAEEMSGEPEIDFGTSEPSAPVEPEPEVKTVKVRTSVDVMAELEALRKKATQSTPKTAKRDIFADIESLRPKRDLHRALHVQLPVDLFPQVRSVRVTLSFENGEGGVIETREQQMDLGNTSDVQSLSVNLKIDPT